MTTERMRVSCWGWLSAVGILTLAGCDEPKPALSESSASVAVVSVPAASAVAAPEPCANAVAARAPVKTQKLADCPTANIVEFGDEGIEKAVRFKLRKESGAITKADLGSLRSLNLSDVKLERLDLCLFYPMKGLKELFLGRGSIRDLSPIAGATKLESLRASLNPIESVEPLAKLTKLDRLDLAHTEITDLAPLAELTSLTELLLDSTQVADISPLAKLEKLEVLALKNTRVEDLSPLKGLKALKSLDIRGARVQDTLVVVRPGLLIRED